MNLRPLRPERGTTVPCRAAEHARGRSEHDSGASGSSSAVRWAWVCSLFCSLADVLRIRLAGGSPEQQGIACSTIIGWPGTPLLAGYRDRQRWSVDKIRSMPLGGLSGSDRESRHSKKSSSGIGWTDYRPSDGPDCPGGPNFRYSAMCRSAWLLTALTSRCGGPGGPLARSLIRSYGRFEG